MPTPRPNHEQYDDTLATAVVQVLNAFDGVPMTEYQREVMKQLDQVFCTGWEDAS